MCAINPKHQIHFELSIYTSLKMPKKEFKRLVTERILNTEQLQNSDGKLRWHFKQGARK